MIRNRPNYDLLVRHNVSRVLYSDGDLQKGSPTAETRSLRNDAVLSSRASNTLHILQGSGIGPSDLVRRAGVDVVAKFKTYSA